MLAVLAPIAAVFVLGVYWLQRLFGEYQRGNFFSDGSMRCFVWLVWLKASACVCGVLWPLLLMSLSPNGSSADVAVSIEAGTIVELTVLLLIVYLLREAQQIHDENKAFV